MLCITALQLCHEILQRNTVRQRLHKLLQRNKALKHLNAIIYCNIALQEIKHKPGGNNITNIPHFLIEIIFF